MGELIACVGRRRLDVAWNGENVLLRIMIKGPENVLANLLLELDQAKALRDELNAVLKGKRPTAR